MRRVAGLTLTALGAFLVTLGLLLRLWVPGQVIKFPLNEYSVTTLTGNTLPRTTLFATKPGMVYAAIQYRRNSDTLALVLTSGALVTMDMKDLDWITTTRLNSERGVRVNLQIGVLCNGECAGN